MSADRPRLVAGAVDHDVEPRRGQEVAHPLRPLDERDPAGLALVDHAARERVGAVGQPVQVDVEQRQPALVLRHQDERRRADRAGHAQPGPEALRELRLARPELAPQADEVAGTGGRGQRRARAAAWPPASCVAKERSRSGLGGHRGRG